MKILHISKPKLVNVPLPMNKTYTGFEMQKIYEGKEIDNQLLDILNHKVLDGVSTYIESLRRARFIEERYFELFLKDQSSRISEKPIVTGLYFAGRGKWIKPWVEIRYLYKATFKDNAGKTKILDLEKRGWDISLFNLLSQLIPAGGHLTITYENDETEECLRKGFHPAVSPLGYLLWRSGFRWFKNWYFPEGWREGGTKLQGNKPLDDAHKKRREQELQKELELFLKSRSAENVSQIEKRAIDRAKKILSELK